jgi:hypothetical protein
VSNICYHALTSTKQWITNTAYKASFPLTLIITVSAWFDSIPAKSEVATMNLAIPFLKMLHIKFLQQSTKWSEYKNLTFWWVSLKEKYHIKKPRHKWETSTKMDLQHIWWEGVDWMHLSQDRNMVMNFQVPQNAWNFLTRTGMFSISSKNLFHWDLIIHEITILRC